MKLQLLFSSLLSCLIVGAQLGSHFAVRYFRFLPASTFAAKLQIMPLLSLSVFRVFHAVNFAVHREDWRSSLYLCFRVECDRPLNHHSGPFLMS
jgi:hypothetical protein